MRNCHGFTLVELITVMVITGIIATVMANLIITPMEGYGDMKRRAELVDIAELTFHRMARDIRRALPNSVKVPNNNTIEILHTIDGGQYKSTGGNPFQAGIIGNGFDLENKLNNETQTAVGASTHFLSVYNLGQSGANAYAYENTVAITHLTQTAISYNAFTFPFSSPQNRFFVIDKAITFSCIDTSGNGVVDALYMRQGYNFSTTTPTLNSSDHLLATNVSRCLFKYNPGTLTRPALVILEIEINDISQSNEKISLLHQIFVENQP